ncbi:MarR family transcriptional regulator [Methanoculleus taiwanensis]|uniref:MarR family transcriptional regulator n=1 Tax=Methanoculleus taiwanensis TaxID=1550565 RepID=A0A498GXY8_9EURY|nr:MarR family transcriptional regulator [Methanoculleus taiwanensis]RXE55363.1 MarR family transcriptional regulator [Methanoculleus taiwanensis]
MIHNSGEAGSEAAATEIVDLIARLLNKAAAIEREPIDIGHGVLLHASEVHLIDAAGRHPDESVSEIASRLGITKGAVSQTVKKLEAKGYLERGGREGDRKTVVLHLTDRGREAFAWHRLYHETVNRRMAEEIAGFDQDAARNLRRVLEELEGMLESCPAVRKALTEQFLESKRKTPE